MGVNRQDAKKMRERTDWERGGEVNRRWAQARKISHKDAHNAQKRKRQKKRKFVGLEWHAFVF
jgi:hypothetical protein